MATAQLILGGPGSGKTATLVERAAERYASDPFAETLVLVPTARHGDQFRQRLVQRCGVALRLRVATLAQYAREAAGSAVLDRAVAVELLAQVTASEVARAASPAAYFAPLAGMPGLVASLARAVEDLLAEEVDAAAFVAAAETSGDPRLRALGAVYEAYAAELARRRWLHPAQAPRLAGEHLVSAPELVLVDGFQFFRGGEVALLAALEGRGGAVMIALDPDAGARAAESARRLRERLPGLAEQTLPARDVMPSIEAHVATDREDQLRRIAREIKELLTRERALRPSDCAVTFRQVAPHLAMARAVFAEYDLPLDPAAAQRLSERPFGLWTRRLLRLAIDGWRLRDLGALLRSDFIDRGRWGLDAYEIALVLRYGRRHRLWAGREPLERIAAALREAAREAERSDAFREAAERAAEGVERALEELSSVVEPASPASPGATARRIDDALFGPRGLVRPASRDAGSAGAEMDALRRELHALIAADEALALGSEDFAAFSARLEARMEAPSVLLREAGGVLLAPMHTLHGLRFAYLAVGGLVEGEFPARRRSGELLDDLAREALAAAGLPLPPPARASEDELWAVARSRADGRLSAWRTRLDDRGREAAASYYLGTLDATLPPLPAPAGPAEVASRRELAVVAAAGWSRGERRAPRDYVPWQLVRAAAPVEQRRRSFASAGAFEGRVPSGRVPWVTGPDVEWSASRLEAYRTCSFQFFGRYALRLSELDEEMDGADAATRGSVIHEILQAVLAPLAAERTALNGATIETALERLRELGPRLWEQAPAVHGFGRAAVWRLDGERVLSQLETLLRNEAEWNDANGVTAMLGAEVPLHAALEWPGEPPLRIGAHVDRLDAGPDFVSVVDYKSGREIPWKSVREGDRLQLQLYALLAQRDREAARALARYAYLNPGNQPTLDSATDDGAAMLERAQAAAFAVRANAEAGRFEVAPQVTPCPRYCAFIQACRVNQFSRYKQWS